VMATAPLAWLRSITSVSTVGYTRHWALWTVAATERGLVILESGGRRAAATQPREYGGHLSRLATSARGAKVKTMQG
jgi:hypothetical protein